MDETLFAAMSREDLIKEIAEQGALINALNHACVQYRITLEDASAQISYLHEKFSETGSGNTILVRIADALANEHHA